MLKVGAQIHELLENQHFFLSNLEEIESVPLSKEVLLQIPKDSKNNPRDLLSDRNTIFHEPETLRDEGCRLYKEVLALREEVFILHDQIDQLIDIQDYSVSVNGDEHQKNASLSMRITELYEQKDILDNEFSNLKIIFSKATEDELRGDIINERTMIETVTKQDIKMKYMIKESNKQYREMMDRRSVKIIDEQDQIIEEYSQILDELREEENQLLGNHKRNMDIEEADKELELKMTRLEQKLKSIEYQHRVKQADLNKLSQIYETQVFSMKEALKQKELRKKKAKKNKILIKRIRSSYRPNSSDEEQDHENENDPPFDDFDNQDEDSLLFVTKQSKVKKQKKKKHHHRKIRVYEV